MRLKLVRLRDGDRIGQTQIHRQMRTRTDRNEKSPVFYKLFQVRDAIKSQPAANVRRFVDASPIRSNVGFLPRNRPGIRAVRQSALRKAGQKFAQIRKSGRKNNYVEFFAQ